MKPVSIHSPFNKIIGRCICAVAFMIPFAKKFVPGLLILLALFIIIRGIKSRHFKIDKSDTPLILSACIFILHLAGMIYSEHRVDGWNEIGIKSSYILFPVLAFMSPVISRNQKEKTILWFVYGCLAFIILATGYGLYRSITLNDFGYLSYQQLGIYFHPSYAATYQALTLFILLQHASLKQFLFNRKWFHYTALFLVVLFISMLASKAGLIAVLISISAGIFIFLKNKQSKLHTFGLAALLAIFSLASFRLLPGAGARLESAVNDVEVPAIHNVETAEKTVAYSSTALRLVTWKASWQLIKTNPLGVGTGDTTPELVKQYDALGETYAAEKNLNAHNQFLQMGAEHGWPAMLLIIGLLVVATFNSYKNKQWIFVVFLALLGMNMLFESFLEVQAGIVFFGFWLFIGAGRTNLA